MGYLEQITLGIKFGGGLNQILTLMFYHPTPQLGAKKWQNLFFKSAILEKKKASNQKIS